MMLNDMVEPTAVSPLARAAAWAVHAYTATGAVTALAAILAVFDADYRTAFFWLAVATIVDATDGVLARVARVRERIPSFDGARLDDIVDYLTYVFVPVVIILSAALLPAAWSIPVAVLVLLSSAYGFASLDAKSGDHFFTGFPSYWNIVALYLVAARLPPAANAGILVGLAVLVFVRTGYVYPTRTPVLRSTTIVLGGLWAVIVAAIIVTLPDVPRALLIGSLYFPVYYFVLSLILHRRRTRS